MRHTPGAWSVATPTYGADGVLYILAPQQSENEWPREVAVLYSGGEDEQEANARLIAAAPELLAALKEYIEWFGPVHGAECPADDTCDCIGEGLNARVNDAIRKAEGAE